MSVLRILRQRWYYLQLVEGDDQYLAVVWDESAGRHRLGVVTGQAAASQARIRDATIATTPVVRPYHLVQWEFRTADDPTARFSLSLVADPLNNNTIITGTLAEINAARQVWAFQSRILYHNRALGMLVRKDQTQVDAERDTADLRLAEPVRLFFSHPLLSVNNSMATLDAEGLWTTDVGNTTMWQLVDAQ